MSAQRFSGEKYERLRRRAAALEARALMFGGMTASLFAEGTAGMTGAERAVVAAWLPQDCKAELDADRGRS